MRNASENGGTGKMAAMAESIGFFNDAVDKQQSATYKEVSHTVINTPSRPRRAKSARQAATEAKEQAAYQMCPCAANTEDEVMVQCEGCSVWYHIPCAG